MNYWKSNGAPAEKLLVGFATYGHTFLLASSNTAVGAPASGPGAAGPFTRQSGFWAYYEICNFLKLGATQVWDAPQEVPYAFHQETWVGYDNIKSFQAKIQWLKKSGFGGAMVWSLDLDDFSGTFCGQGKYPLINTIKSGLGTGASCTSRPDPLPPVTPTGGGGSTGSGFCAGKANGMYPDTTNKNNFYNCTQGNTYPMHCAAGLVFDESCKCCNWA
ncbi:Acidic mammalian chitinase [Liparis tanakae]|uniref:chitinase n=1 Tax=Liparis tanakae TaxID=230148 RepID=A0A4Z2E3A2_9TELE|nr:Acidic mammalian chitinase [Liparis tanakae]